MFVTPEGHPGAIFQRAVRSGNVAEVEALLLDMGWVPLEHARALVELHAEKGSAKYEPAALKYLGRYLAEANPSLAGVAQLASVLAERLMLMHGR
ncbi:MAG TPA: hypothetical protein VFN76_09705 [Candidatus Limnocylindria bacterium]|jgi:hypothetical protein|nr:hypothetical protein [Candidatus Limnocylindria bacterium]